MPEGDSVYRLARRLHSALAGADLTRTEFRVPQLAGTDLSGCRVIQVVARGKHLLIRLKADRPDISGQLSLHSHLMMEGRWDLYAPGQRWKRPAHTARMVLETATMVAVAFEIQQLRLLPTDQEHEVVGHLGPDLLGPDWDAHLATGNLLREPQRPLGTALLDQRLLAGVGNIYRCEILFLARLHPETPCAQVENLDTVVSLAHRLLQLNKDRTRRVTTGLAHSREPFWVYGRTGKPCLRCSTPIRQIALGDDFGATERDCYYCPACQKLEE
ncbi:Fpg/Nei family DNA glycosylase [Glutamicibacter sp. MNS18]|uniref:Fpg/Nei family DNA glycosylase n=1 Tax=Glutamicibacter sp. MNS18 TaxID=2989817 RepID=UPI0022356E07|nr:DNA-formamidopyrimidine glycosylase family protein [Glutamicibacter sp. MNS18]MCW4465824.1 Fpg/Nei family DNA glycosylase [Glutamicibacter sp. MNS18]